MSALDLILATESDKETGKLARAELAALRATVEAQARQLSELIPLATELVNALGYWIDAEQEPQECLSAELALGDWLAANAPAPQAQPAQRMTVEDERMLDE